MEQDFFTCSDFEGCEALFEKAAQAEAVGVSLLGDKEGTYGLGLALNEDEIYYIPVQGMTTPGYLSEKLESLSQNTMLCSMDVKAMLKHIELRPEAKGL